VDSVIFYKNRTSLKYYKTISAYINLLQEHKMATSAEVLQHARIIDAQAASSLLKPNKQLDSALANSKAKGLPDITISELQGQYLAVQCKLINAKSVLEIGTLGGYSTIWFASTGAKVTSIEINPKHRDVALENTKGLDVDIILGSALEVMLELAAERRTFDFVFIDASWDEQFEYFQLAVKLTRPGGCIYVDNVVRELLDGDIESKNETLLTKVGTVENAEATLVSTVSSHKNEVEGMFDGFLLAIVK
jgi:predicted O-methyltransferase YrrM